MVMDIPIQTPQTETPKYAPRLYREATATIGIPIERRYLELILRVPGFYGKQARTHIAQKATLPDAFYNYDERKVAMSQPASIRISGDNHHVYILGIGEAGIDTIGAHATTIANVFRKPNEPLAPWLLRDGSFSCTIAKEPQTYSVTSFVVALPEHLRAYAKENDFEHDDFVEIIRTRMNASFMRQCAFLKLPFAPQIDDLTITKSTAICVKETRYFTSLSLSFTTHARLGGPWQLGRLQARGYGRVVPQK